MKKLTFFILISMSMALSVLFFLVFPKDNTFALFDYSVGSDMPRYFRSMQIEDTVKDQINIEGLSLLNASGSSQFYHKTLKKLVSSLPLSSKRLLIIDLREESHGFINGLPLSWRANNDNNANCKKTVVAIIMDEKRRLYKALKNGSLMVRFKGQTPAEVKVENIETEQTLIESLGYQYIRMPVADHQRPADHTVDQFIYFIKNLNGDEWLHFHCRAGKGRTTTFLAMLDMLKNSHQISFDEILERQRFIGGFNLKNIKNKLGQSRPMIQERLDFLEKFYQYCCEVADFHESWSAWIERKQKQELSKN